MDQNELDRLIAQVRQALAGRRDVATATPLSEPEPTAAEPPLKLVTEAVVRAAHGAGATTLQIAPGAIITPLGADALRRYGLAVASVLPAHGPAAASASKPARSIRPEHVAVGVVPAARDLEAVATATLRRAGIAPLRVPSPVRDAAQLARQVAGAVSGGQAAWGIIIDETGMAGPAIANRVPGVVAATCGDPLAARWARERLGANVLCVAAEAVASALLQEILATWIGTPAHRPPDVASVLGELDRR